MQLQVAAKWETRENESYMETWVNEETFCFVELYRCLVTLEKLPVMSKLSVWRCPVILISTISLLFCYISHKNNFLFYSEREEVTGGCNKFDDWELLKKSYFSWNIRPCSPLKVNRHFGGKYGLHLQSRRISQERNHYEAVSLSVDFQLITRRYTQKIELYITTAVKTSDPNLHSSPNINRKIE
jgi:hypothetical protein